MEIYGRLYDKATGAAVPYASVQRLYPGGEIYSGVIVADSAGKFNGRVPGTDYKWQITSVGYKDALVTLQGVADQSEVAVAMEQSAQTLPSVTITPVRKTAMITALIVAGIFLAHRNKWI